LDYLLHLVCGGSLVHAHDRLKVLVALHDVGHIGLS
jgi:hypothetical protein